jgi:hypothetical protein
MSIQSLILTPELRLAAALLATAALSACTVTVPPAQAAPAASVTVVEPAAAAPAEAVYTIKSGSYQQWNPANPNVRTTVYFDDFGNKTSTTSVTDVGGRKTTTVVYNNNDGYVTTYVTGSKTATRTKYIVGSAPSAVIFPAGERKVIEVAEIAGVKCEGWVVSSAGVDTRIWTYKGIPCKTESGKSVVMETTLIKEETPPADEFTVPAEVVIREE